MPRSRRCRVGSIPTLSTTRSGILRDRTMSQAIVYEDWYQPARQLPGGGIRYVVSGEMQCRAEAGSDFDAILRGAVSIGRVRNLC